jgi:GntR family transcriptional regulator
MTESRDHADAAREFGDGELDRDGRIPLYFQLRDALLEEIRIRALKPGDRLPGEADLERRYGVSRATIRQALAELETEGRVKRIQGKGTFVAAPKIQHLPLLTSFTQLLRTQGYEPSHRILESRILPAPARVADDLGAEEGTLCRFLRRLLLADGRVVGVAETWLAHDAIRDHEELFEPERLASGSLYELLQGPAGIALARAVETITAVVADEERAGSLGCEPGSPVLAVKRVTSDRQGRGIESTLLLFSGERYEYQVDLLLPRSSVSPQSERAIRSASR